MEKEIIVYILYDEKYDHISKLFDETYFKVICKKKSDDENLTIKGVDKKYINEYYDTIDCLRKCKINYPGRSCLVIHDTMTTLLSKKKIKSKLSYINKQDNYDIFLLFCYLDKCQALYERNNNIYRTYEPYGSECVLYKPSGIDMMLGDKLLKNGTHIVLDDNFLSYDILISKNVVNENIICRRYDINIFNFNMDYIRNPDDYYKFDLCRTIVVKKNINYILYFLLFIVFFIILVFVVILFLLQKPPSSGNYDI